jgi:hypothetical protein
MKIFKDFLDNEIMDPWFLNIENAKRNEIILVKCKY